MKFTKLAIPLAIAALFSVTVSAQNIPSEEVANSVHLKQIGAYAAWQRGYTGLGIRIAVVDTGADTKHGDLKNIILTKTPNGVPIRDVNRGHGTQMISLAAGAKDGAGMIGVAYNASVLAVAGGSDGLIYKSHVGQGIVWSADNKADVINLSLGNRMTAAEFPVYYKPLTNGSYYNIKYSDTTLYSDITLLSSLKYATAKGSIVVMAAGNDGLAIPTSPANLVVKTDASGNLLLNGRGVIVGSVDSKNIISSSSNRAGHICQQVAAGLCVDKVQIKDYYLVAPGVLPWGANANWQSTTSATKTPIVQLTGTSASAAFVSGGVAVIKQAWPTLAPEQIVQVLLKTATDLGAPGVDVIYGNGLMNLDAATKPLGTLTLAKITSVSSTKIAAGPTPLAVTGLTGGLLTKQSFDGSSVLQNAQVVDSVGRNFTVNITNGLSTTLSNYSPATAYSALSETQLNYVDLGNAHALGAIYTSSNMNGVKFGHQFKEVYVGIETGSAIEHSAVLGTRGAGALAIGDSKTNWNAVHFSKNIDARNSFFGSVAQGQTNVSTARNDSMISFGQLATRSWSLGVANTGMFSKNDRVSFQVTEMPRVVNGSASITAVTDYNISNVTEDGATVTPVVTSEKLSLVNNYRQYATTIGYANNFSSQSGVNVNLTLQSDNVGSTIKPTLFVNYTQRF